MAMPGSDLRSSWTAISPTARREILASLTEQEAAALLHDWPLWARDKQLPPPGDWLIWLVMAGRGFGKTRTGAEYVRMQIERGAWKRVALVARTAADARDVMVEGESGLLSVCPPWNMPRYEPSKRRLTWPNGAIATTYSGDKPDQLRGPQHDGAWADELAAWRYPEAFDQLMFGLRLGQYPRLIVTTTPRPTPLVRGLNSRDGDDVAVVRGSTFENEANLAPAAIAQFRQRYENTRLGRQELFGEILDDVPGALWTRGMLEAGRLPDAPRLSRIVVAIDPAATATPDSSETGIVVAGMDAQGHGYVLEDYSIHASPDGWGRRAVQAYEMHEADRIIAEKNNGGDMVEHVLRTISASVPVKLVWASRGKATRAEPVAALYEQGRVHHVGYFAELEDQMCTWVPGETSPDRMDALVWALTELMVTGRSYKPPSGVDAASKWRIDTEGRSTWRKF